MPDLADEGAKPKKSHRADSKGPASKIGVEDSRKAAAAFEREQKRRDAQRRRVEAEREKERAKREKLVAKAQGELDAAQREHEERSEGLEAKRRDIEKRIEAEDARWEREEKGSRTRCTGPGNSRQRLIYPPQSSLKFCGGPLKVSPDFQILSASSYNDRDAVRVPPIETGTGRVRCRS